MDSSESAVDKFLNSKARNAIQWQEVIEDMINSGDYDYADDTLRGINEYIEINGDITEGQQNAVTNIQNKPSQPYVRRRH